MAKFVGFTELIFNGKTLIIYLLIYNNFGVLCQISSRLKLQQRFTRKCIFKQINLKISAPLHTKVTEWT